MIYSGYLYDQTNAILMIVCVHRAITYKLAYHVIKSASAKSSFLSSERPITPLHEAEDKESNRNVLEDCIAVAKMDLSDCQLKKILVLGDCNLGFSGLEIFPRFLNDPAIFLPLFIVLAEKDQEIIRLLITADSATQVACQSQFQVHHALDGVVWAKSLMHPLAALYQQMLIAPVALKAGVEEVESRASPVLMRTIEAQKVASSSGEVYRSPLDMRG